jgi:hypothetical protein
MVWMDVGIDYIADRAVTDSADCGQQCRPVAGAAAGVDHGDGIGADDERNIGDVTFVGG